MPKHETVSPVNAVGEIARCTLAMDPCARRRRDTPPQETAVACGCEIALLQAND